MIFMWKCQGAIAVVRLDAAAEVNGVVLSRGEWRLHKKYGVDVRFGQHIFSSAKVHHRKRSGDVPLGGDPHREEKPTPPQN